MLYLRHFSIVLLSTTILGCFSAKGLPVKEVKDQQTAETTTMKDSLSDIEIPDKVTVEDDVQTDYVTMVPLVDHSKWDALLKKYVASNGDVDYKGFQRDREKLNAYTSYLSTMVPSEAWSVNEQLAYFINVYNANTIQLIIDNYPTKSIKDVKNPWLKNRIHIGDKAYSLADIENGILRKMNEPRIHFAINCASISCPKLLNTAYTATNVQELMEQAAIEFINDPKKNKLSETHAELSKIFKWYKGDFTDNGALIDYINRYAKIKVSANAKISYLDYNWNLNEQNP